MEIEKFEKQFKKCQDRNGDLFIILKGVVLIADQYELSKSVILLKRRGLEVAFVESKLIKRVSGV
ncbi:MAG: hypothetical protein ACP5M9_04380 [Candidatus Micrarchaeia archaeon]